MVEEKRTPTETNSAQRLGLISRRAFLGKAAEVIKGAAGVALAAAVPPLPVGMGLPSRKGKAEEDVNSAKTVDSQPAESASDDSENLENHEQYDLSDYRLPFDGTYNITQGRSQFTIDHQECTVQFHTTHQGLAKEAVDFSMISGVPIKAAQAGEVIKAGWLNNYGNVVIIQHRDGLTSWYGHLSKLAVKKGDVVRKGQQIGDSGKSGTKAGHLHFEIRNANNQSIPITIDGLQYFGGFNESCSYTERFEGYGQYPPGQKNDQNLTDFNPQRASILGKDD